jgi:DNA replicative helicase MCM subunit Mcm2 (Cdc46/Mcm family)
MSGLSDEGPQERFEEFLRTYKDEKGKLVYWSRLQQMSINDESSIVVNFQDLAVLEDN